MNLGKDSKLGINDLTSMIASIIGLGFMLSFLIMKNAISKFRQTSVGAFTNVFRLNSVSHHSSVSHLQELSDKSTVRSHHKPAYKVGKRDSP